MTQITPMTSTAALESSGAISSSKQDSSDLNAMFSEIMWQAMTNNSSSAANSSLPASLAMPGLSGLDSLGGLSALGGLGGTGDMESTLLAQAMSGQAGSQDMLMCIMMLLMKEFANSDLTPMFSVLTALSGQSSGSSAVSPARTSGEAISLRPSALAWKDNAANNGVAPAKAWLPSTPQIRSGYNNRSADRLRNVIDQFAVESAERYRPYKNGNTYCNIFVWDVTRALDCEIPHYVDRQTGEPRYYPDTEGAYELDANGTHDWLVKNGAAYGWQEVSAEEAQAYANAGFPAVTAWKNTTGKAGHVQIVCPSLDGSYDERRGVTVAQAGSKNYSYAHLNATMSKDKIPDVKYFIHA